MPMYITHVAHNFRQKGSHVKETFDIFVKIRVNFLKRSRDMTDQKRS